MKCLRVFKTPAGLKLHERLHDGEKRKPFESLRSDEVIKGRLIEERSHKCETCGLNEWRERPIPLQLEHRDGNPTNRQKDNLQLICPNCHAQTDTYCGKNIGRPKCKSREKAKYPAYRSAEYLTKQISGV